MNTFEIESDEDGRFYMTVTTPNDDFHRFAITDSEALYDAVRREIGPWLHERELARRSAPVAFMCNPDESGGYDLSDPKHPEFHSVHADLWDSREGK